MNSRYYAFSLVLILCSSGQIHLQELDSAFGQEGVLFIDVMESRDQACELFFTEDNEIVVAGHSNLIPTLGNDVFLTKYTLQGDLDNTFGDSGIKLVDILNDYNEPTNQFCKDLVFAETESFILADHHNEYHFDLMLVKYDESGHIDSTFGTNGIKTFDFFDDHDYSIGIQKISSNDNLYVGYYSEDGDEFESGIFCLDTNGIIDPSFGNEGFFRIEPTSTSVLKQVRSHDNSLYYVFTNNNLTSFRSHSIGCIMANGVTNPEFNSGLPLTLDNYQGTNQFQDLEVSDEGYIYIVTTVVNQPNISLVVRKFHEDGGLVESFGNAGTFIYESGDSRISTAEIVQDRNNEGLLIIGTHLPDTSSTNIREIYTLKLTPDGQVDSEYGLDGRFDLDVSESSVQIESVIINAYNDVLILGDEINTVGGTDDDLFIIKLKGAFPTNVPSLSSIDSRFEFYPIPTKELLTIKNTEGLLTGFQVIIYNQLGAIAYRRLINEAADSVELDLSLLNNGLYYIRLIDAQISYDKSIIIAR